MVKMINLHHLNNKAFHIVGDSSNFGTTSYQQFGVTDLCAKIIAIAIVILCWAIYSQKSQDPVGWEAFGEKGCN